MSLINTAHPNKFTSQIQYCCILVYFNQQLQSVRCLFSAACFMVSAPHLDLTTPTYLLALNAAITTPRDLMNGCKFAAVREANRADKPNPFPVVVHPPFKTDMQFSLRKWCIPLSSYPLQPTAEPGVVPCTARMPVLTENKGGTIRGPFHVSLLQASSLLPHLLLEPISKGTRNDKGREITAEFQRVHTRPADGRDTHVGMYLECRTGESSTARFDGHFTNLGLQACAPHPAHPGIKDL